MNVNIVYLQESVQKKMLSYLSHPHRAIMSLQSYISSIRICHLIALLPGEYYPSHYSCL